MRRRPRTAARRILRALAQRTPESILEAMTTGIMRRDARALGSDDRRAGLQNTPADTLRGRRTWRR